MNINPEEEFNESESDCDWGPDLDELRTITFNRDELLYIDDNLTMMLERGTVADNFVTVRPVQATAGLPSPVELLDKIGMAILQVTDEDLNITEATLQVTATDLYMLREIAKSTLKINGVYVGLILKKKIYSVLYEVEHGRDKLVEKLLSDVPESILDWSGEAG